MKVNLAAIGRFHNFELARQLRRHQVLGYLYTGYPRYKVNEVPGECVKSFPYVVLPAFGLVKLGINHEWLNRPALASFERWVARTLTPCDVFHCLSGMGLRAHRAARERYGALTACDRGSVHIVYQDELLAEEYARHGLPYQPLDPRQIEKEVAEYEFCDFLTVPSEFVRQSFLERGFAAEKINVVTYGVNLEMFRPLPKLDEAFRVLHVGTVSVQKGVPDLLEACAKLPADAELRLIGALGSEIQPVLDRYAGRFEYHGFIPRPRLAHEFSQASVFVLASIQDGFATVVAQAMACGLPVIASSHTGGGSLITDGVDGFIVPPRRPDLIRERLTYLYENPEQREAMGAAALRRVQSLGGWQDYGDRFAALLRAKVEARNGSG